MSDLRALAEKATPGPWQRFYDRYESGTWCIQPVAEYGGMVVIPEDAPVVASDVTVADAAYIAAASPDVILRLLDRIDALEKGLRTLVSAAENYNPLYEDDPSTVDAFYADVDAARSILEPK